MGLKSTIAVHARYHAFRLGEGLSKFGVLDKIYTLYPKFKLPYKIPADQIKSFSFLGILKYLNSHYGFKKIDNQITSFFDDWVSLVLKKPSEQWVFTGYSGFSEKSLIKAKKMGAVTLVERACPHIDEQEKLLREERNRLLHRNESPQKNFVYDRMKREYEIADRIVVPSRYSYDSFVERGFDPKKILITPLSNEKETFVLPSRKKDGAPFTILCVGGHFYRKGIFYLLKAWETIGLKDAKLILKGEVPHEFSDLTRSPNLEIINRHLPDGEMNALYNSADVFVLPSIDEGFGMVVLEAMNVGLPVIVTENVGAADILKEGKEGFIIPIRDPEAIKDRLSFFYSNWDKVIEMGKNALETAQNYTSLKYAERMIAEYKKLF